MTRRDVLLGSATALASQAPAQRTKRRNVIFILSDDHRYDALGLLKSQPWLNGATPSDVGAESPQFLARR